MSVEYRDHKGYRKDIDINKIRPIIGKRKKEENLVLQSLLLITSL